MEEAVPGAAAEETLATPLPVRDEDDLLWESSEKGSRQWGGGGESDGTRAGIRIRTDPKRTG